MKLIRVTSEEEMLAQALAIFREAYGGAGEAFATAATRDQADQHLQGARTLAAARPTLNVALSGGSTPAPFYRALAAELTQGATGFLADASLTPDNEAFLSSPPVHFFQVDERYVPASSEDSNQKMIAECFAEAINQPKKSARANFSFSFFDTSLPIEECLRQYENSLKTVDSFDLCVLGIGEDGHIASIFPGKSDPANSQSTSHPLAIHTTTDQFAVRDRLSLSLPVILASRRILVLLKGASKQAVIDELFEGHKSLEEFPAKALMGHKNLVIINLIS